MFCRRAFTHLRVGDRRLAPMYGRQLVLPAVLQSDFLPFTGALSACADRPFGERSPT
ncbi:MAG: hypothetical protein LBC02_09030 [Planctomycetaceae bacterium]|nr:hypothetical protein [Planctomycetaceae bacterium]